MMQEHLLNNNIGCIEICVQGFKIIGLALLNNNIGCVEKNNRKILRLNL